MLDHFMQQARARVEARMQSPSTATPQSHRTTTDPHSIVQENIRIDVENELCIERCIALTEDCLARARAFLAQPNKLPERLSRPVETAERRRSSGRQLTRPTAKAVGLQSRRAYDDAQTRLRLQEARRTALPPSSRGAATEAASRDGMSLHSGSESEELEFAQASSTGGMYALLLTFAQDADGLI